jgi:hypothetical protein
MGKAQKMDGLRQARGALRPLRLSLLDSILDLDNCQQLPWPEPIQMAPAGRGSATFVTDQNFRRRLLTANQRSAVAAELVETL